MRQRGHHSRIPQLVMAALLAGVTVAVAGPQEQPAGTFGEFVEVRLVNVEAWVTDAKGNPVTGLQVDDFEIFEDGKPVTITYFTEVGGRRLEAEAPTPEAPPPQPAPETRPAVQQPVIYPSHLVLYFDQLHLSPASRKRLIKDVRTFLASNSVPPERILVLRQDWNLHTEARFGSDRVELEDALFRVVNSGTANSQALEKRLAVNRLQQVWDEIRNQTRVMDPCDLFVTRGMNEVELYTRESINRGSVTLDHLTSATSSLAVLPGVKTLVYVADALDTFPGRDMVSFMRKYCPDRPELSSFEFPEGLTRPFLELTLHASANRVTFYAIQPSGLRSDFLLGAENRAVDQRASTSMGPEFRQADRSGLSFLAVETGGRAIFNRNRFADEFREIGREMATYYSLAYEPPEAGRGGDHQIEVRVKSPRLKVRHRQGYKDKGADERMTESLQSALYLGLSSNPLEARLGAGTARPTDKKKFTVPLHIRLPAERITFLAQEGDPVAYLKVEVAVQTPNTSKLEFTRTEFQVPEPEDADQVTIELVVSLELSAGQHVLAVAVRDEATQETSYVSTSFAI